MQSTSKNLDLADRVIEKEEEEKNYRKRERERERENLVGRIT